MFFLFSGKPKNRPVENLLAGTSNLPLAQAIADPSNRNLANARRRVSDGETFVKIDEMSGARMSYIVQRRVRRPTIILMEMFIMMARFGGQSASRIHGGAAFYGYARRIGRIKPRFPSRQNSWPSPVAAGANRFSPWICTRNKFRLFDIPVDHLYAAPVMYEYLRKRP